MAAVGLVNGWLIAYVEIPAMLATLASAMVIAGFFRFVVLRGEFLLLLPKTNPAVDCSFPATSCRVWRRRSC